MGDRFSLLLLPAPEAFPESLPARHALIRRRRSLFPSYGAAGALLVVLLWVYYSSEIFLLGAEFTRAYSVRLGSRSDLQGIVHAEKAPPKQVSNLGTIHQREVQAWIVITGVLTIVAARLLRSRRS